MFARRSVWSPKLRPPCVAKSRPPQNYSSSRSTYGALPALRVLSVISVKSVILISVKHCGLTAGWVGVAEAREGPPGRTSWGDLLANTLPTPPGLLFGPQSPQRNLFGVQFDTIRHDST